MADANENEQVGRGETEPAATDRSRPPAGDGLDMDIDGVLDLWEGLQEAGQTVDLDEFLSEHCGRWPPERREQVRRKIRALSKVDRMLEASVGEDEPEAPPSRLGHYELRRLLGSGGFGEVWEAWDVVLDRAAAVKVLRLELGDSPQQIEKLQEEAKKLAQLDHPGIVPVYDFGTQDGRCYLVSKLIPGEDLAEKLSQGSYSPRESALLVAHVADALHYAHKHGIIHRDVKPTNILLDESGSPVLADFGIAATEEQIWAEGPSMTGTLWYMAPEQAKGEGHFVTAAADVYGLGVVLYEMLTGRVPFKDESLSDIRDQIISRPPPPPRTIRDNIPPELERICLKCLEKDPGDRYTTAKDLAAELRAAVAPKRPLAVRVVAAVLGLICVAAVAYWLLRPPVNPPKSEPAAVIEAEFFLRRGGNDTKIRHWPLVAGGQEQRIDTIERLASDDDLKLTARLDKPANWYIVWIDTRGEVFVDGSSQKATTRVSYPSASEFVTVDEDDPPGVHLLLLVSGNLPAADGKALLEERLHGLGPPPAEPQAIVHLLRGPGRRRPTRFRVTSDYLAVIEERMPEGLTLSHALSFEAGK